MRGNWKVLVFETSLKRIAESFGKAEISHVSSPPPRVKIRVTREIWRASARKFGISSGSEKIVHIIWKLAAFAARAENFSFFRLEK